MLFFETQQLMSGQVSTVLIIVFRKTTIMTLVMVVAYSDINLWFYKGLLYYRLDQVGLSFTSAKFTRPYFLELMLHVAAL